MPSFWKATVRTRWRAHNDARGRDPCVTKEFALGGVKLAGIAEVFTLFNHANYDNYNTQLNSTTFGDSRQNTNSACSPWGVQLAFRVSY